MRPNPLLILDADGVFMDEMPYWNTALVTMMHRFGMSCGAPARWELLSSACFVDDCVQGVTKGRGCNSNWDLAAVMIRAVEDESRRAALLSELNSGRYAGFASRLKRGMEEHWREGAAADPLNRFGIERSGAYFQDVVAEFQLIFEESDEVDWARIGWSFERQVPVLPASELRALFVRLKGAGFTLGVCTSRAESETVEPMSQLGTLDCFDRDRVVTNDQAVAAEARLNLSHLAKPHPFPLLCAALDFATAIEACRSGAVDSSAAVRDVVYVGDAPADFEAAQRARALGLPVTYVHIDSGLSPADVREAIEGSALTGLVAPRLSECETWLSGCTSCVESQA